MDLAERRPIISLQSHVDNYDRKIIWGYVALAALALVAIYFASGGPGMTEAEFAVAVAFP